ncbi:putative zinc-type alcohol dehydrogenase-like protein YjmD [Pirellulimonas nuda]|uniref:Putative zinc-type alcohol dehydrogenase-like protein YjmD n=1 Tax=Pirellulimonas nuda TaxID=2528009 RepID=A0A518DG40_9BACT|nr:zinc-binding alcohol dehydrogenase family protein [Pirellulimonas nuda]QDU90447.1 putative zinc-type alcohol dehydrogenase-like protein YjmD [Pirellulimonas nuda]
MKALEITAPGECRLTEVPTPQPGAGEVLLRVRTVGFCGSDLNTFRGLNPLVSYPRVPGHEIAATIEQLGEGVDGWSVGTPVLVFPYTECGKCSACRADRPNCCRYNQTLGVQREGAMSEFFAISAEKIISAEGLSFSELALVEPLTVGFHAAARGQVRDGDTVAVFGAGAIGLGAIAGAAFRGARVIAIDVDDAKLELATACGAAEAINSRTMPLHDRLQELTDGHGPDVVIEAVGLAETFVAAVEEVAFAGRVVYIGYAKAAVAYETKLFVMKELDIRGSRNALKGDFENVIKMLSSGGFPSDRIVSHQSTLDDAGETLAAWGQNPQAFTKIHVDFPLGDSLSS